MNFICSSCAVKSKHDSPILKALLFPSVVSKKYQSKLDDFEYIKIDMRNPALKQTKMTQLRQLLKKRRKCHKMFD